MLIEMSSRRRRVDCVKRTALVVEDDPRLQKAMSMQFGRMDFDVLLASHYDDALRHLATGEPQLACVDVGLPNKSGYELCEHIRGSLGLAELPILMTSDYGTAGDMAFAEDAGGNAFLRKPFTMQELTDCVESMLNATRRSPALVHELKPLAQKVVNALTTERAELASFRRREHTNAA
jgi:two-component system OmpR family response regulator